MIHFTKFEVYCEKSEFRKYVRGVFAALKKELNITFEDILEWLNQDIRDWVEGNFVTKKLYTYDYPCLERTFGGKTFFPGGEGTLVYTVIDSIVIGTFLNDDKITGFDLFDFRRSLNSNFEGTVKLINEILNEKDS